MSSALTRRQALKQGALGVASLTVAERLLAYGGQNEALAALQADARRSQGYGPLQFEPGKAFALPKGFRLRPLRPRRLDRCPTACRPRPATTAPATSRAAATRVWIVRNQEGFHPGRAHGPAQRLRPRRPGRGHGLALRSRLGQAASAAPWSSTGPTTTATAAPTPWGTWLSGEENTVGPDQGYERRARLRLRGPGARDLDRRAGPDQGDGPLRPRGLPGRPEDGDRLHDRGQRRPRRRLLSLPAPPQGQAAPRRQAPDARDQGQAAATTRRTNQKQRQEARMQLGRHRGSRSRTAPTTTRRPSTCRAATRAPRSSWASRAAPSRRAAATSRLRRRPRRAGPDLALHARQQGLQARDAGAALRVAAQQGPQRARRDRASARAAGSSLCEDGDERGRQRRRQLGPRPDPGRRAVRLRQGDREDAAPRPHRRRPVPVQQAPLRPARPSEGQGVGASETAGAGFSPDGKWLFLHLQYPGETFAITGPWDKGWL